MCQALWFIEAVASRPQRYNIPCQLSKSVKIPPLYILSKVKLKLLRMTILELLQKNCKTKGVDAKHAARIEKTLKVTKAEDVETAVDNFKENILPVIEEAEATAKKDAEKEAKKTASKEAVKAWREKHGLEEDGKPVKKEDPKPGEDEPSWFKTYREQKDQEIEDLKKEIKTGKTEAVTAERKSEAVKLIGGAKLPESWVGRVDLTSETPLEDQVEALKTEYTEIQQTAINAKVESGEYSPSFQQPKERSEEEWAKLMDESEESSDPGVVDLGIK
jgi:hypothetical protein